MVMVHNLRRNQRYPLQARVELIAADISVPGAVLDISMSGAAFHLADEYRSVIDGRNTWVCRLHSDDLPTDIAFVAKVIRQHNAPDGTKLACQIRAIAKRHLACLQAYRTLAVARMAPPSWKRRLYQPSA